MSTIAEKIALINHEIEVLKPDFAEYIKDRTIPLQQRWYLFSIANDRLSKNDIYLVHFEDKIGESDIENMGDSRNRGETIYTVEWVEGLVEDMSSEFDEPDNMLDPLREEILQKNLKSFCFDW